MTASESMAAQWAAIASHFQAMSTGEIATNVGASLIVAVVAFASIALIERVFRFGVKRLPGPPTADKKIRTSRVSRLFGTVLRAAIGILAHLADRACVGP